jgi:hypothetical protein
MAAERPGNGRLAGASDGREIEEAPGDVGAAGLPDDDRHHLRALVDGAYLPVAASGVEAGDPAEVGETSPEPVNSSPQGA